jgi:hypothetical protein
MLMHSQCSDKESTPMSYRRKPTTVWTVVALLAMSLSAAGAE